MHKIYRSSVINMETAVPIIVHTLNTGNGWILPVFEAPDASSDDDGNMTAKDTGALPDAQSVDGGDDRDDDPEAAANQTSLQAAELTTLQAAQLIAKAEQDAVKISQDAFREGYAEGMEQGLHDMETVMKSAEAGIRKVFDDLAIKQEDILRSMEKDILALACDIAEKILGYELDRSDGYLAPLLNSAVRQLKDDGKAVIKLCVNDYLKALSIVADIKNSSGKRQQIELVDDTTASRGDCVMEFENGIVDCGITSKLNNVKRLLDTEETAQV